MVDRYEAGVMDYISGIIYAYPNPDYLSTVTVLSEREVCLVYTVFTQRSSIV